MEPNYRESIGSGQAERSLPKRTALSSDQQKLLKYLASEYRIKEIAQLMNKDFHWVQNQVHQLSMKYNTNGRIGVVVNAIKNKHIKLNEI